MACLAADPDEGFQGACRHHDALRGRPMNQEINNEKNSSKSRNVMPVDSEIVILPTSSTDTSRNALIAATGGILQHTLAAALLGWKLFPCGVNSKKPDIENNLQRAATPTDQIRAWFTPSVLSSNGIRNYGIAMGESGAVAIDFDPADNPGCMEEAEELIKRHADQGTPVVVVDTPSGGCHLYFRQPAGFKIGSDAGKIGKGIDHRGYGGYVVGPGSDINGRAYRLRGPLVCVDRLPELPLELAQKCNRAREQNAPKLQSSIDIEIDTFSNIKTAVKWLKLERFPCVQGSRNNNAYKTACMLRDFALSEG